MGVSVADQVWNRAALESGGESPGPGDRALAALLLAHGLVMNGGVHHALECLDPSQVIAAADGFAYFGLDAVASFFREAASDRALAEWTEQTEHVTNEHYWGLVPDDSFLESRFQAFFRERPREFSPV
jgi:hypothetical protein